MLEIRQLPSHAVVVVPLGFYRSKNRNSRTFDFQCAPVWPAFCTFRKPSAIDTADMASINAWGLAVHAPTPCGMVDEHLQCHAPFLLHWIGGLFWFSPKRGGLLSLLSGICLGIAIGMRIEVGIVGLVFVGLCHHLAVPKRQWIGFVLATVFTVFLLIVQTVMVNEILAVVSMGWHCR